MVNGIQGGLMMTLTYPWLLLLLPVPVIIYKLLPSYRQKALAYRIPFFKLAAEASGARVQSGSQLKQKPKTDLFIASLFWLMIVIALSNPVKLGDTTTENIISRDIMLAIDLSGSMDEQDFDNGNGQVLQRLAAVKNVVSDFISNRETDRIGLIVFGTRAYLQVPFTTDLSMAKSILDDATVSMAGPHTAIGDAIGLSLKTFTESQVEDKALILLTDGADTGSRMSPVNAAHIAQSDDLKIFTIGIGQEDGEGQYKVDFDTLKEISNISGGKFYRANNSEELGAIYQEIDKIAVTNSEKQVPREKTSLTHLPLGGALFIYLFGLVLTCIKVRKQHV